MNVKILIATSFRIPGGGIWTFVRHLKNQLELKGHEVDIFGQSPELNDYHLYNKNQTFDKLPFRNFLIRILGKDDFVTNNRILNAEINRYCFEFVTASLNLAQYDIIHAQDVIAARSFRRVKPRHIPIVTSVHGYLSGAIYYSLKTGHRNLSDEEIYQTDTYQYYRFLERIGYQSSDLIHTSSRWMRNNITNRFSVKPDKIVTFPYGMDIKELQQYPQGISSQIQKPKNKKVILTTSRLVYLKGIHDLLDSLERLKQERDDWVCWILGDGEMKKELEEKACQLGLNDRVFFLGTTQYVGYYLQQADIFVLPSLQENQPFALIEAQLFGLPAIVSDSHGLPELVQDGETGFIFPAGDSKKLYSCLTEMLEKDTLRIQMGERAKKWGEQHWSTRRLLHDVENLYQRAIQLA